MKDKVMVVGQEVSLLPLSEYNEIIERGKKAVNDIPAIFDQDSYAKAVDVVKRGKTLIKNVNDIVNDLTRPFKDAKKRIDEAQNEIKAEADKMLGEFTRLLGNLESMALVHYNAEKAKEEKLRAEQADLIAEANRKIADAAAQDKLTQDVVVDAMAAVQAVPVVEKPKGMRTIWKYEIIDADLVPRAYCDPTPGKLQQAVRDGMRIINGVRIYEDQSL